MHSQYDLTAKKGRLSLSINQSLLNRLEPYKQEINFSAHAEQLLSSLLEQYEHRTWAERNANALIEHGQDIAATGLAGSEFERI
jgi:antitoxin CcdA